MRMSIREEEMYRCASNGAHGTATEEVLGVYPPPKTRSSGVWRWAVYPSALQGGAPGGAGRALGEARTSWLPCCLVASLVFRHAAARRRDRSEAHREIIDVVLPPCRNISTPVKLIVQIITFCGGSPPRAHDRSLRP